MVTVSGGTVVTPHKAAVTGAKGGGRMDFGEEEAGFYSRLEKRGAEGKGQESVKKVMSGPTLIIFARSS
ncbi:hypothetical protein CDL15_Pgr022371 [Punica granatum]|uniref:Uncharacterized protein n=1 Tax=Punica granatum TaxID=22663 RepID=A0A218Y510_PUNGR|nr:hypothetical protein CDL15_Pgr022371 [Punica granatum]